MSHRCPDGTVTKLIRSGPVGTTVGVTFTCPHCGMTKTGDAMIADFDRVRPLIVAALGGGKGN